MKYSVKKLIRIAVVILLIAIPYIVIKDVSNSVKSDADKSWDSSGKSAYVSAFISKDKKVSETDLYELQEYIENDLKQNGAYSDKDNDGSAYTYAYSASKSVTVSNTIEVDAKEEEHSIKTKLYGVGGNFFLFHKLNLVSGSYFNPDEQAHDLILIDEDVAWELFGSSDVVGMEVEISGQPYVISGVFKRNQGKLYKEAGADTPTIYMSYLAYHSMNSNACITCYEGIIPNLTKGYALKLIKKYFKSGSCDFVENSDRFSLEHLFTEMTAFFDRSMKKDTVVYPYWENVARGAEDICIMMLFIEILVIIYAAFKIIKCIRKVYKKMTFKPEIDTVIFDIGNVMVDFIPEEYMKKLGFSDEKIADMMENVIEGRLWNEYDKGILSTEEVLAQFIAENPDLESEINRIFTNFNGIIIENTFSALWVQDLKNKGKRVLYLSNISDKLYNDCKSQLTFIDDMDGGILSFEAKCSKPDKKIFEMIIEKYNLDVKNCLFIDDREANINAAKEMGFNGLVFKNYMDACNEIEKKFIMD